MKILFISILTLLVLSGCSHEDKNDKNQQNQVSEVQNTNIVLTDTDGKKIKVKKVKDGYIFEGYEGKIVLLNFFATWCPPCKAEIPHLNNLQEKYAKDLKIISVLLEENKTNDEIKEFIKSFGITFTVANSQENFKLAKDVGGVQSIPLMIIYDRQGKSSQSYTGAIPEEMIESDIKKVL